MCGRYTLTASRRELADAFAAIPRDSVPTEFQRYNIAPSQQCPIVRQGHEGRIIELAQWGFIPAWARDPAVLKSHPINARSDRAAQSPMFRNAFHRRRCLVPASGFYEWQRRGAKAPKQPYYLHPTQTALLAFAGLWERWTDPAGNHTDTFTILTTDADERVAHLHDRMPVILPPTSWAAWLDAETGQPDRLHEMLQPYPLSDWMLTPVSRHVNKPAHDDPTCVTPIASEDAPPHTRSGENDVDADPGDAQGRLF